MMEKTGNVRVPNGMMCMLELAKKTKDLLKTRGSAPQYKTNWKERCWDKLHSYTHKWADDTLEEMAQDATALVTDDEDMQGHPLFGLQIGKRQQRARGSADVLAAAKAAVTKGLGDEQIKVVNYALDEANANKQVLMLIHGKWGTGKTRTTNATCNGLKRIGDLSVCSAPTGVAATNYRVYKTDVHV